MEAKFVKAKQMEEYVDLLIKLSHGFQLDAFLHYVPEEITALVKSTDFVTALATAITESYGAEANAYTLRYPLMLRPDFCDDNSAELTARLNYTDLLVRLVRLHIAISQRCVKLWQKYEALDWLSWRVEDTVKRLNSGEQSVSAPLSAAELLDGNYLANLSVKYSTRHKRAKQILNDAQHEADLILNEIDRVLTAPYIWHGEVLSEPEPTHNATRRQQLGILEVDKVIQGPLKCSEDLARAVEVCAFPGCTNIAYEKLSGFLKIIETLDCAIDQNQDVEDLKKFWTATSAEKA